VLSTSFVKAFTCLRALGILCGVLTCCLKAGAQSDANEVERQRDAFIGKVFTKCSDDVDYFGPHEVDHVACVGPGRTVTSCAELIEYKNLKFPQVLKTVERPGASRVAVPSNPAGTVELALTKADTLAQVERKVLLLINYESARSRMRVTYTTNSASRSVSPDHRSWAPEWDEWEKPIQNAVPSMSAEVVESQGSVRLPSGTKAFGVMIKRRGLWSFAPGPDFPLQVSLSQITRRIGLDGGQAADQATEPLRGLGAAVILAPIAELLARSGIVERIASQKPRSCTALFPKDWPGKLPPLVAPGTPMTAWAKEMLNPPKFSGTPEQFVAAFPGLLSQAAQAAGFDAQAYQKESAFVTDSVRACAGITPEMAAKATRYGQVVMANIGEKYKVCQSGGSTPQNTEHPDTQIVVQVSTRPGRSFQDGTGFTVLVFYMREKQGNYPIVSATITRSQ